MRFGNEWRFVGIVFGLAITAGGALISGFDSGGLLFAVSPLAAALTVSALGRLDSGSLDLRFKWQPGWYGIALGLYPIATCLVVSGGVLVGTIELGQSATSDFILVTLGTRLVPGLVLAACEEIGWRGYLTPALSVRGMSRIANHLTVGLVWTVWRVPLLLGANGDTTLGFAPLFLLGNLALAVILGEMRLRAGTIWPVILTRGIGIALTYVVLDRSFFLRPDTIWFAPRPDGLVMATILALTAWVVTRVPASTSVGKLVPGPWGGDDDDDAEFPGTSA
jgi:membrane protease YdiL (CAAX protease family)